MSTTLERLNALIQQAGNAKEDTIIPAFKDKDQCVFCTEKNYDSLFYDVYRRAYQYKIDKKIPRQNKKECIHHTDDWLKHSLSSAGYLFGAFTDEGKRTITNSEAFNLMKDQGQRLKLINKHYDLTKNYSSAIALYLPKSSDTYTQKRYSESFTIDDDVLIQNKIIRKKIKIYYEKALEVLSYFDEVK